MKDMDYHMNAHVNAYGYAGTPTTKLTIYKLQQYCRQLRLFGAGIGAGLSHPMVLHAACRCMVWLYIVVLLKEDLPWFTYWF